MIWLYRLLLPPLLLLALPYYGWRMWKRGGYGRGWKERLGWYGKVPPKPPGVKRIWVQAVSVGELLAVGPLLQQLLAQPDREILLTTTTSTGYRLAEERYAAEPRLHLAAFAWDLWPSRALSFRQAQADALVLMEGELWPEALQQAQRRSLPVLLVNARLSDRSFRRYRRFWPLAQPLLRPVSCILAATEQDAARWRELGLPGVPVEVTGSLKFDVDLRPYLDEAQRRTGREALGFADAAEPPLVLLGSSTWPGEEALLLETLRAARTAGLDLRLLLVPRHAERRSELQKLLREQDQPFHFRSESRQAPPGTRIYVADTTGELRYLTQLADLAFIGKSMPPRTEGQTPIEAAGYGLPILFGPGMGNFRDLAAALVRAGVAEVVLTGEHLTDRALALLQDPAERLRRREKAQAWFAGNRGATERTVQAIQSRLGREAGTGSRL